MKALRIKDNRTDDGRIEHVISGFTAEEIDKIHHMRTDDALVWVLEELDERNDGIGTIWYCGYGVQRTRFQIRMADKTVVVVTGVSCC